jgi:hypothetical protein
MDSSRRVKLSGAAGCCQSAIGAEGFLVVAIIVGCPGCHLARGKTLATVWASHLPPGAYRAIKATLPAGSVVYPPERNARLVGCSKRSNLPPYTGFEHFERIEQRTEAARKRPSPRREDPDRLCRRSHAMSAPLAGGDSKRRRL